MLTVLIGRTGHTLSLSRGERGDDDTVTLRATGPVILDARALRALRDLAYRERLPEEPLAKETNRTAVAQGLRAMADWIETAPDALVPSGVTVQIYALDTLEAARATALAMAPAQKTFDDSFFRLTKDFGGRVKLEALFYRHVVCTSRVVGKRMVEAVHIEAHEADVVEWDCHSLLADQSVDAATELPPAPERAADVDF